MELMFEHLLLGSFLYKRFQMQAKAALGETVPLFWASLEAFDVNKSRLQTMNWTPAHHSELQDMYTVDIYKHAPALGQVADDLGGVSWPVVYREVDLDHIQNDVWDDAYRLNLGFIRQVQTSAEDNFCVGHDDHGYFLCPVELRNRDTATTDAELSNQNDKFAQQVSDNVGLAASPIILIHVDILRSQQIMPHCRVLLLKCHKTEA